MNKKQAIAELERFFGINEENKQKDLPHLDILCPFCDVQIADAEPMTFNFGDHYFECKNCGEYDCIDIAEEYIIRFKLVRDIALALHWLLPKVVVEEEKNEGEKND